MHGSPERRGKKKKHSGYPFSKFDLILWMGTKKCTFFRRAPEVSPILVSSEISSAVSWCASPSWGQNKHYSNQHWEIWTWKNTENFLARMIQTYPLGKKKKKIQTVSERNKKVKVLSWQNFFLFCLFLRHNTGENNLDLTLKKKKMDHLNLYF